MERSLWNLVFIVVVLVIIVQNLWKRRCMKSEDMELPPGPWKLPIIGNLHQLNMGGELVHVTLAKMAQEHGKIMTVWFGGWQPSLIVSHHDIAWEVLVSKASDFSARTLSYMSKVVTADWQTMSTSNFGPYWHTLRKGFQIATHTISAQVNLQEKDISSMILSLLDEARYNDGMVKPLVYLRRTTVNLIGRFCFGSEFKDDAFVNEMDDVVEDTIRLTGHARLIDVFEFARYTPGLKLPFHEAYKVKQRIEELITPYISQHKSTTSPCSNCYLHFLLSQDFSEEIIIFNLFELFWLAVDSTSTAIVWALAFLIHNKKVQQKLYEEVSRIEKELVTVEEVSKLKYVHAIVKETMRMKPIAPLGVPHRAARDSNLMGTKVMKGTPIFVNLYAILYDPNVWVEPERFMPERFLVDSNDGGAGSHEGKDMDQMEKCFLSFGAGRRICPGMELAKVQVALCLANLVKRFQWSSVVEGQPPDLTEDVTFVLRMKTPLVARIVSRCT